MPVLVFELEQYFLKDEILLKRTNVHCTKKRSQLLQTISMPFLYTAATLKPFGRCVVLIAFLRDFWGTPFKVEFLKQNVL